MLHRPDRFSRGLFAKEILQQLRMAILSGQLPAKHRLIEAQLAEEYGVSRVPVRSALHTLEQQGLVQTLPKGGAEVVGFTEKHAFDLLEARMKLEEMAARKIVKRAEFSTSRLHSIVDEMSKSPSSPEFKGAIDFEFHLEFMKLSDNWALSHLWLTLSPIILDLMTLSNSVVSDPWEIVKVHAALLEALDTRNLDLLLRLIDEQFVVLVDKRFKQMFTRQNND